MTYPSLIQIETSGVCNASCSFCPHSTMARTAQDTMPRELFTRIIDDLASWLLHVPRICPFLTNEPFADPRIFELCHEINDKLPSTKLVFFTNGSLFNDTRLDALATLRNVDSIHVSLHHSTQDAYEADLHLSWHRTLTSVHRLVQRGLWNVKLLRVQSGDTALDSAFLDFCAREFPTTPAGLSYRYNWKGDIASPFAYESTLDRVCPRHSSMTILCDGRVALCCLDERGEYTLGDTRTERLVDIYNSERAIHYRNHVKRANSPCDRCNHP